MAPKRSVCRRWISYVGRQSRWLSDIWYVGAIISMGMSLENDGSYYLIATEYDETGLLL